MNTSYRLDTFIRPFFALMCCGFITGTLLHAASEDIELGWATAPVDPFEPSPGTGQANAVAKDLDGNIILAGLCNPSGSDASRFAALQLIPGAPGEVALGWATAPSGPFGPSDGDVARGVAIDTQGAFVLVGEHKPDGPDALRFAALQLIPSGPSGIVLGWATAISGPFGPVDVGDSAQALTIDASGNIIIVGFHDPTGLEALRFAALQLIPNMSGGVDLGWATALDEPFGPSEGDIARGVAIDLNGNFILAGTHNPAGIEGFRFAALQLIPNMSGGIDLGWATAPIDPFSSSILDVDMANGVAIDQDGNIVLAGTHAPISASLVQRFAALQLIPNMSGGVDLGWATAISGPFGPVGSDGDAAHGLVLDVQGNPVLAGSHDPMAPANGQFAALQLIPNLSGNVDLGWATAISGPFGPIGSNGDAARGIVLDAQGNPVLAGFHRPVGALSRFAALQLFEVMPPPLPPLVEQLSLPFVPLAAA